MCIVAKRDLREDGVNYKSDCMDKAVVGNPEDGINGAIVMKDCCSNCCIDVPVHLFYFVNSDWKVDSCEVYGNPHIFRQRMQ